MSPLEIFEAHGSFCRTGSGTVFALEAFSADRSKLTPLQEAWGGSIYEPPPAAPSRLTWRLYGKRAEALWSELREQVSEAKRIRGDRKLSHCQCRFGR